MITENRAGHVLRRSGAVVARSRTVEAAHRATRTRRYLGSEVIRVANRAAGDDLGLTDVTEAGHRFATGVPVSFTHIHNTEKAPRAHGSTDRYQQKIEPAGYYVLVEDPSTSDRPPSRGWIRGQTSFRSPLVLLWNDAGGGYDDRSWKAVLSRAYGGKRGAALSRAIKRAGHDGIVTVRDGATSEVVDLSRVG